MNNQATRMIEDEIDLRDLLNTLLKKKLFIIAFTSIITVLGVTWALVSTPIYEIKSNLQIGFIGKELIAEPNTLIKTVKVVFNVDDKKTTKDKFVSEVTAITKNKDLNNFIEIRTQGISNEEALQKNKEVVDYIKNKYASSYQQFILDTDYKIQTLTVEIKNLTDLVKVDIKRKIELLKTQDVAKINEKIHFYEKVKIESLKEKIKFHTEKLNEYTKEVDKIYKESKETSDTTALTILSLQILNYQNLILNSQNNIENLKVEMEQILREEIVNLQRSKVNLEKDTLRKLEYKLNVELPNEKIKLDEEIKKELFHKSEEYAQNSIVVGDYIVKDSPVKPKKALIVVLSCLMGLMLSVFIVLFLNFFAKEEDSLSVK